MSNIIQEPTKPYDVTKYDRPSVTVDVVIFSILDEMLKVLLIKRKAWPFEGGLGNPWRLCPDGRKFGGSSLS